jgi:hypothetical protein
MVPTSDEASQSIEQRIQEPIREASPGRRTTEGSFHSAKEDQTAKLLAQESQAAQSSIPAEEVVEEHNEPQQVAQTAETEPEPVADVDMDDIGSPSDESTPDRPLVRKGSLNFATLPPREPMKTSIGPRISHQKKSFGPSRNSHSLHHQQPQSSPNPSDDEDIVMEDSHIEILGRDESSIMPISRPANNESAAQRLQKKIEALGKAPPPRPSKSIPSAIQISNRQSEAPKLAENPTSTADDDDDWIKPLQSPQKTTAGELTDVDEGSDADDEFDVRAPELIAHEERMAALSPSPPRQRPGFGHAKSASTATLASPAKAIMAPTHSPAKSISVSNPAQQPTTTPQGSPRRYLDLSASKSRLQSIMKSAKGLFTSSASVSAAAKMETLSSVPANVMPGMFPRGGSVLEDKPLPKSPVKEVRKTRSSTEREKEEKRRGEDAKAMERMDEQLQKAREKEAQKAAHQKQQSRDEETEDAPQSKLQRPTKPIREPTQKSKPAPVAIKVGTLSQRVPIASSIAVAPQETLPAEPKRPGLTKKASSSSISSNTHFKSSAHAQQGKPKALLAAERKREADEREAKRKADAKRELERKREEARQQEARQRAEVERKERERVAAEQAKRQAEQQAKQQAIERKRQEAARKAEQQRQERAQQERETSRPPSRAGAPPLSRSLINHAIPTNPAKPAKRPLDEESARPQAGKFGQSSQAQDSKRRRTEDEGDGPRPTMSGAPIRQSNLGKKASIFNHPGYAQAPQPGHMGQFPQPPSRMAPPQMSQYAHSKIPFADQPGQHNKTPASASHKTPASAFKSTIQAVKSSPQYTPGERIDLPEIPTDSEDEDSDEEGNAFPIPDWATPGHLTEQLIRQEGMDGDAVFGPIAPLKMEEIFAKGNKERLKRLRDRTSSANWAMSGDGLTLEEVRADREQRERMRVEGGWRYGLGK